LGDVKEDIVPSGAPGYRLGEPRRKPKIGPYLERIAQIIEEDKALPKKQRHTAKRIYERLREMGYGGKYTQVKGAVSVLTYTLLGRHCKKKYCSESPGSTYLSLKVPS
jgi:transposase